MTADHIVCSPGDVARSPLIQSITQALRAASQGSGVRVSIEKSGDWIALRDGSGRIWAKGLCWNIIDDVGRDVTKPALVLVHGDLTTSAIDSDLRATLPGIPVMVDNDIAFK